MMSMPAKLKNPQHQRFVAAYTSDEALGNATKAAELAQYAHPGTAGSRMLQNVAVAESIADMMERREDIAGREERLSFLTAMMRGEIMADRVNKEGDPVTVGPAHADRNAAAKLLCKIGGDLTAHAAAGATRVQQAVVFATVAEAEELARGVVVATITEGDSDDE